jgi:peptidoglycan hydrolase-like protein with peptidoglycan-binding domain
MSRLPRLLAGGVMLGLVGGGGWWLLQGGAAAGGQLDGSAAASTSSEERKTASVERRTLTVTEELDATLGHAGTYEVAGGLTGTLTWTVREGTVVTSGERLYETDGSKRASLMYGSRPAWRSMQAGVSNGADIRQLEENLQLLGYTRKGDRIDSHWDSRTTAAVKRWQRDAHLTVDGKVDLGEVVFLPEAIRVTDIQAKLGSPVGHGATIATGTSNRRVVTLDLDAADSDLLVVDKAVEVELPDGTMVDGTVSSVGRVAETTTDQQGGSTTTLPVTITLDDPEAAQDLDQAPVEITVIRSSRENVLTVPVSALLALLEGGYAVEVVDGQATEEDSAPSGSGGSPSSAPARASTHLVVVEPGLFDHGYVEITADGLEPGDLVVVPS